MSARAEAQVHVPASPFVYTEHWSYHVLRRLDDAGVLPVGVDAARQSIAQEEIAGLLAVADSVFGTGYLQRFREEFAVPRPRGFTVLERTVEPGGLWTKDQFAPGVGYDSLNWSGARALADQSEFLYGFRVGITFAPYFAWAGGSISNETEFQLNLAGPYVGAWAGRRKVGYSVGNGGGMVLNAHDLLGGGLLLTRAVRLPLLGPVRFETHFAKVDNVLNLNNTERSIEPWFWTARGSFEPHAALRIGVSRAMMFGGEGNLPITFGRVARNLVGVYTHDNENSFANQVFSVDFRWRIPSAPMTAYLEWGSDDAAGALADVPGIMGGLNYVRIAPHFDLAIGVEHLQFSRMCCGNSIWYRNAWFRGSWADGEELLGHDLGGNGREWRLYAHGSVAGGAANGHAAVYARRRRAENVLVPAWQGKSTGFRSGGDVRLGRGLRFVLDGEIEWGAADWSASRLSVSLRSGL